jgi:hypothetical protein
MRAKTSLAFLFISFLFLSPRKLLNKLEQTGLKTSAEYLFIPKDLTIFEAFFIYEKIPILTSI